MKKVTCVLLAALVWLGTVTMTPAQQPPYPARREEDRCRWCYGGYGGGNFHRTFGDEWVQEGYGGPFHYVETMRTPEYVELYDRERHIFVRLYPGEFRSRPEGQPHFSPVLPGRWER